MPRPSSHAAPLAAPRAGSRRSLPEPRRILRADPAARRMAAVAHRGGVDAARPLDRRSSRSEHPRRAASALDRLQLTAWALLRGQQAGIAGSRSLATGGHARRKPGRRAADLQFHAASSPRRCAPARRSAGAAAKSRRASASSRCVSIPVWLTAERRQRIGQLRRRPQRLRLVRRRRRLPAADAVAASASTPISRAAWSAFSSRDLFVDGGADPDPAGLHAIFRPASACGAEPSRASTASTPARGSRCGCATTSRVHLDWRQRLAGNAAPGFGTGASPWRAISERARDLAARRGLRLVLWPRAWTSTSRSPASRSTRC